MMTYPPMRPQLEIQFLHDMLLGVYSDPQLVRAVIPEPYRSPLAMVLDCVCWVLHHDTESHPNAYAAGFATMMRDLREDLEKLGWDWEPMNGEYIVEE
jgi:hypothetical protein